MAYLSVVINAQNVEKELPRAILSVKKLADEIVVIDQNSSDKTSEVAKKLGAKVFKHESVTHVEKARNFAISKASNPWVLILDPDEEIPSKLAEKIKQVVKNPKADYYRIPRKNIIFGRWVKHSRWWPDNNIRLFKKNFVSWNEVIHTVPMTQGIGDQFEEKEEYAIIHHNYDSIEQYIERMNRYSGLQAEIRVGEGYKFTWRDLITRPLQEFLSRYFFGEGYKDGIHGLALSLLQSFSELTMYLKIWQISKFKEEEIGAQKVIDLMRDTEKELHFWQNDTLYKNSGKITDRIRRKLRI